MFGLFKPKKKTLTVNQIIEQKRQRLPARMARANGREFDDVADTTEKVLDVAQSAFAPREDVATRIMADYDRVHSHQHAHTQTTHHDYGSSHTSHDYSSHSSHDSGSYGGSDSGGGSDGGGGGGSD